MTEDQNNNNHQTKRARSSEYSTNVDWLRQLMIIPVERFPLTDDRVFVATRDDRITDVWKGMIEKNFLSVPVLQKTGYKYYGFVDAFDIVKYFIEHFGSKKLESSEDFWSLIEEDERFQRRTVKDVMTYPIARRNPFHPVKKGFSLFSAFEILAKEDGVHRIPVIDTNRKLINLLTQSQCVRYLNTTLDQLGTIQNKPLKEISHLQKDVKSILQTDKCIDGFNKMVEFNVQGLAVLDQSGKLIDTLSVRDLKHVSSDGRLFWRLYQPVSDFLKKVRDAEQEATKVTYTLQFAKEDDTLGLVIRKLVQFNLHRLFLVDADQKPIGVVSLKDVLFEILQCA